MFYSAYALEGIAAVVMLVAILCFFAMALDDRQAQLRTLRSIGATRSQLTRSLLWEAALIGLIGGVFGCMLGYPLAKHMAEVTMHLGGGFELDFMLRPEIIALTIVGAICICTVGVSAQIWRGALDTSSPARGRRQP